MKYLCLGCAFVTFTGSVLAETPTHCEAVEQMLFNCRIKDSAKVVSLCASKELSAGFGYIQYRFGQPGKVELEFPKERQNSRQRFQYAHYFRFQIDRTELGFHNGGFEYALYHDYDGEVRPAKNETGVRVNTTLLPCGGMAVNRLSMLAEVVPCDEDNPLGSCR